MAIETIPLNAKTKRAYNDGASLRRAGGAVSSIIDVFSSIDEKASLMLGFRDQHENNRTRIDSSFLMAYEQRKVGVSKPRNMKEIIMRTKEELAAAEAAYREVYDPYATAEQEAGREPQPFDEAFAAHLEALDADAAAATTGDVADVAIATATKAKPEKAAKPVKAKKEPKAKPAPKPKAPKAFRPTSADRAAINVVGKDILAKAKVEGAARFLPAVDGFATYADFLSGKQLKLDADGNGTTTLKVVTARDSATVLGVIEITVKKGVMSAKGRKA